MDALCELPFQFLRVPNLKLRLPSLSLPSAMTVFGLVWVSCYLVFSGIIYDVIVEPPAVGSTADQFGNIKPQVFLPYRINGQYIIEGLSGGFLFLMGGLGFIILDKVHQKAMDDNKRWLIIGSGLSMVILAYNLAVVFIRRKLPGYLY
ncbi:Oligosaccharyltransferase complex subunit [Balamuthia mandrillaris]